MSTVTETAADRWRMGGRGGRQRLIPDPDTGELVAYQRTSTFANTLDDKEGLIAWKAWMAVRGTVHDKALTEQALHAQSTPKGVVDQLAELGGAGEKRDRGADRHTIVAMALTGAPLPDLPPPARAELDKILRVVDQLGTVAAVEAPNVCDRWQVCGRADLIVDGRDGSTIVCDLKTGRLDPLAASIQLVSYAAARYWDWDTESRGRWVAVDRPRLVVIHAPQDGAEPVPVDLDVERAKRWADLAAQVRDARKEAKRKGSST